MIDALYIAETGLNSQSSLLDVVSNNIANISTPGYKKTGVNFTDLVYQNAQLNESQSTDNQNSNSHQVGLGTRIASTYKDFSAGALVQTNNPMDIAINGDGFVQVELPDGSLAYTRAGRLNADKEGFLTTAEGYRLTSRIQLPPDTEAMAIAADGKVLVKLIGEAEPMEVGTMELMRFVNPEALNAIGSNLYTKTIESGDSFAFAPDENGIGTIIQGYQEVSNVSLTEEMVHMMTAQRAFQLSSRVVQVADQMLETVNNMRR